MEGCVNVYKGEGWVRLLDEREEGWEDMQLCNMHEEK